MRTAVLFLTLAVCALAQNQPFTADAMLKIARIGEPQLSPDGRSIAFTVERPDFENNTRPKQIYVVPVAGGVPVQITKEGNNQRPRWMPDGQNLVFLSDRSGTSEVWSVKADGADPKQLTTIATGAEGVLVSPDGKRLLFTSDVYPGCADEACSSAKAEAEKKSKIHPRIYTSLLYRHWTTWQGGTRKHLMTAPLAGGIPKDLTPGMFDVPPFSLDGAEDYSFSPDGNEVAYVANTDKDQATSTNSDIYVVGAGGGEPRQITLGLGADRAPKYSPDGKYIAYRSQAKGGYESDRWRLMLIERATGRTIPLNENLDRSVDEITWSPDGTRIFFTSEDRGRSQLQMVPAAGGGAKAVISGNSHISDVQFTSDSKTMIYSEQSGSRPAELFRASSAGGAPVSLTKLNDELLAQYQLTPLEEFYVKGADEGRVHSFLIKPAGWEAGKKYPVLVLIHGGPQGAWGESWSYRWNAQVFAGAGFVVVMPNPRGSTGYGQKFTDDINQDWGGKPFDDIMAVVDHVAALPYTDGNRMAAAGGSYGGYMVDWIAGHTDRFRALVSHAGVFDLRSMAGETEELWFPNWEFNGMPWDNPELYAKFSPSYFVKQFKTPTLVIHGELDYRVPVGQGMQMFTALQMMKVPSKFLLFPDEGHWILKPQNSALWYRTVLDWVREWTEKKAVP